MASREGMLGVFVYLDDFIDGLRSVRERDYEIREVFSPTRTEEIQEVMKGRASTVPLFTLIGGILGGMGLVGLAVYAHLSFRLITGAKPVLPVVPWVVVCFEGTILLSVCFSVIAWILKGHLPRTRRPVGYDPCFSGERFGVVVACSPASRDDLGRLLKDSGAEEVRDVVW
jgi:hypothetical protein